MASEEGGGVERNPTVGWREKVEDRWLKIKEHAEAYPYVWASYIFVYGGLGVYMTYRWRKLRRTEARVRVLQERLRKLVEAEESSPNPSKPNGSSSSASSSSPSPDKPSGQ